MRRDLSERLKKIEKGKNKLEELPVTIELLDSGESVIYEMLDGKKRYLTDEEFSKRGESFKKSGKKAEIEVIIGEWEDTPSYQSQTTDD